MTDDFLDPRLVRDLRSYAEGGVRPVNAVAIAQGVVAGGARPRRWSRGVALVLVAAGALLALLGIALAGGTRPPDELRARTYQGVFVPGPAVDATWPLDTILGLRDGTVLLLGSSVNGLGPRSVIVNPATGSARTLEPLQADRFGAVPVELLDSRVLVLGGDNAIGSTSGGTATESPPTTAEVLDPVTGRSTHLGPLHTPRTGFGAVRLADGRVLIAGGQGPDGMYPLRDAEIFDPATGTFTPTGPMVDAHAFPVMTLLGDGRVALRDWTTMEVFDPETGTFTRTPGELEEGSPLITLSDGRALATGHNCTEVPRSWDGGEEKRGIVAPDPNQDQVGMWIVDATTGIVTRLPDLPHCPGTATALPNGQVFVTGWWTVTTLRDTQRGRVVARDIQTWSGIYDPATGATRVTAEPMAGRYMSVVALADGRVLTVGPTMEIFQ